MSNMKPGKKQIVGKPEKKNPRTERIKKKPIHADDDYFNDADFPDIPLTTFFYGSKHSNGLEHAMHAMQKKTTGGSKTETKTTTQTILKLSFPSDNVRASEIFRAKYLPDLLNVRIAADSISGIGEMNVIDAITTGPEQEVTKLTLKLASGEEFTYGLSYVGGHVVWTLGTTTGGGLASAARAASAKLAMLGLLIESRMYTTRQIIQNRVRKELGKMDIGDADIMKACFSYFVEADIQKLMDNQYNTDKIKLDSVTVETKSLKEQPTYVLFDYEIECTRIDWLTLVHSHPETEKVRRLISRLVQSYKYRYSDRMMNFALLQKELDRQISVMDSGVGWVRLYIKDRNDRRSNILSAYPSFAEFRTAINALFEDLADTKKIVTAERIQTLIHMRERALNDYNTLIHAIQDHVPADPKSMFECMLIDHWENQDASHSDSILSMLSKIPDLTSETRFYNFYAYRELDSTDLQLTYRLEQYMTLFDAMIWIDSDLVVKICTEDKWQNLKETMMWAKDYKVYIHLLCTARRNSTKQLTLENLVAIASAMRHDPRYDSAKTVFSETAGDIYFNTKLFAISSRLVNIPKIIRPRENKYVRFFNKIYIAAKPADETAFTIFMKKYQAAQNFYVHINDFITAPQKYYGDLSRFAWIANSKDVMLNPYDPIGAPPRVPDLRSYWTTYANMMLYCDCVESCKTDVWTEVKKQEDTGKEKNTDPKIQLRQSLKDGDACMFGYGNCLSGYDFSDEPVSQENKLSNPLMYFKADAPDRQGVQIGFCAAHVVIQSYMNKSKHRVFELAEKFYITVLGTVAQTMRYCGCEVPEKEYVPRFVTSVVNGVVSTTEIPRDENARDEILRGIFANNSDGIYTIEENSDQAITRDRPNSIYVHTTYSDDSDDSEHRSGASSSRTGGSRHGSYIAAISTLVAITVISAFAAG